MTAPGDLIAFLRVYEDARNEGPGTTPASLAHVSDVAYTADVQRAFDTGVLRHELDNLALDVLENIETAPPSHFERSLAECMLGRPKTDNLIIQALKQLPK
jgi:hypothetical protein